VAARAEPLNTVGVAEIHFKIPHNCREARENQICTMDTKSESENYSLANPGEVRSVAENKSKLLVDANIIGATLHYSVVMTEDGNIRVKDSYCDSKEVSETYFQRQLHIIMVLLFSDRADEQILLDLIDCVMDGIMKAEAKRFQEMCKTCLNGFVSFEEIPIIASTQDQSISRRRQSKTEEVEI
jgi:hypothetical protein